MDAKNVVLNMHHVHVKLNRHKYLYTSCSEKDKHSLGTEKVVNMNMQIHISYIQ